MKFVVRCRTRRTSIFFCRSQRSQRSRPSRNKTARIWDATSGALIAAPLEGHEGGIASAAYSPNGQWIVTALLDKTARVWDAASGAQIGAPLKGHEDWVTSAAFSPDGLQIVTASQDHTARIWGAASGAQLGIISFDASCSVLVVSTTSIAIGLNNGQLCCFTYEGNFK